MFPMRLKIGTSGRKEWRCCFCLHVRTATILLGIWHLILHVLALTVLAIIMRNHQVVIQRQDDQNFLPTPLSKVKDNDNPYYLPTTQDGRTIYTSDMDMGALMIICTLAITLLLVYGTIKGKATYLFPFFCLQLFDFAIAMLTATGYICYLRSVHRLVDEHWRNLPFRKELLQLSPQCLSLLVLLAFILSMMWKAYCIGIVWRCYKYLTLRQQAMRNTIHYILPGEGALEGTHRAGEYPAGRDSEGGPMKQTPPPSYQDVMVMEDQPPPYPAYALPVIGVLVEGTPVQVQDIEEGRQVEPNINIPLQDEAGALIINSPLTVESKEDVKQVSTITPDEVKTDLKEDTETMEKETPKKEMVKESDADHVTNERQQN